MDILVIEDDHRTGERIGERIERAGHRAVHCGDARSALRTAALRPFGLILPDLFLPDAKGHTILPLLRELQPETVIVVLTGCNSRELELKVRKLGVAGYPIKPIGNGLLASLITHVAKRRGLPQESKPGEPPGQRQQNHVHIPWRGIQ